MQTSKIKVCTFCWCFFHNNIINFVDFFPLDVSIRKIQKTTKQKQKQKNTHTQKYNFCFKVCTPFDFNILVISSLTLKNEMSRERANSNKQTVYFGFLQKCKICQQLYDHYNWGGFCLFVCFFFFFFFFFFLLVYIVITIVPRQRRSHKFEAFQLANVPLR